MADKYETEIFDDGTEPTVRKLPYGADQQGRYPEAAEPCTDVGHEDEPAGSDAVVWVIVGAVVVFALGLVAAVLGGKV